MMFLDSQITMTHPLGEKVNSNYPHEKNNADGSVRVSHSLRFI